jgi:hypothetical protein
MNPNVVLPFLSSTLSAVFAATLLDQWRERRRPYQLIWAVGMLWYALSAGTEFLGGAFGWNEPLYRTWYLIGAVWVAGWLGLGTVYLLGRTRFGYSFALSLGLAGLFTFLTWRRYDYPGSGIAPIVYLAIAVVVAILVVILTRRRDDRWVHVAGGIVVIGSIASAVMALTAPLAAPGWVVDPATHIPTGTRFPGSLRLLTPFFNITGAFVLVLGAAYSAYVFMPKRRLIRYERGSRLAPLVAAVAIPVNLAASLPGAVRDLFRGRLHSRVPATILIAIGALIPAITSGANRFGATSGFFVGELLGVLFLFSGFLVSIEVTHDIRIPFTNRIVRHRAGASS